VLIPTNPPAAPAEAPLSRGARLLRFGYTGRRKFATAAALVLVVTLGYHVVFGDNGLTAYEAKRQESAELEKQIEALKVQNAKLSTHDQHLQSDPNAIAAAIHNHIHYVKPGEVIVTVQPGPAASTAPAQTPAK
jgi:cell division protein FtsB